MRYPVPCASPSPAASSGLARPGPQLLIPGGAQCYGRLARLSHLLAAWLIANFGQPRMSEEEAFLAQSTDHADCERRERWLDRRPPTGNFW